MGLSEILPTSYINNNNMLFTSSYNWYNKSNSSSIYNEYLQSINDQSCRISLTFSGLFDFIMKTVSFQFLRSFENRHSQRVCGCISYLFIIYTLVFFKIFSQSYVSQIVQRIHARKQSIQIISHVF